MCVGLLALQVGVASAQAPRRADVPTESGGVIQGTVTTVDGTVPLPGVLVSLSSRRTTEVMTRVTAGDGTFTFEGLAAGEYEVAATLDGFERRASLVEVQYNETARLQIDLRVAVSERVEVIATAGSSVPAAGTLAAGELLSGREIEQIASGGGLQAALRLFVSVIEVPGGVSIKGGLPSQASVQLGPGMFVDPATGLSQARLPDDAIDAVRVLPNPYAVEFGRFASGLVLIETRRATDRWRLRLNDLDPTFRTARGSAFDIEGIASFSPRLELGGPLVRDRLYVQQSAQYRYRATDVPSRPESELRRIHGFSSFTRVDANLAPRHSLVVAGGLFPSVSKRATLGTFTPPAASIDLHANIGMLAVTERAVWSDTLFSETTVEVNRYRSDVRPQRYAPMELLPETTTGPFFNRHRRTTSTYQLIETLSGTAYRGRTIHLFKAGLDLVHSRYDGLMLNQPVLVRRTDGRLARRLDFDPSGSQRFSSTDIALFGQDRVQPTDRWYVEFGARLDRDGVIGRWNVTPRVGSAVLLTSDGSAVLRGGFGVFFERTPSAAGDFEQYAGYDDIRFSSDGVTPAGPAVPFAHVKSDGLRTARSLTWDLAYDHRFNRRWAFHVGGIDRRGSRELVVNPVVSDGRGELRLESVGKSTYREVEVGVHFTHGTLFDVNVSYVRSAARADLNAFTSYFDAIRRPVFGMNQYGRAASDAPHRLLARWRAMPTSRWLLVGVFDWRSGLPYSVVDEQLEFVGQRNSRRFPTYTRAELGVERRFRIFGFEPWIGVRATNAFNAFLPVDVQANIGSPAFGTFYNSEYRQFRIQVRFAR
jgi:hypothetical protein